MVIFLNKKHQIIGYRLLNIRNRKACPVDLRLLVGMALHSMAFFVILAHNHPSGNLAPSNEDIDVTRKIEKALYLIDVKLFDHLILSEKNYVSMYKEGLI